MILLITVFLMTSRQISAVTCSKMPSFKFLYCPEREYFEVTIPLAAYMAVRKTEDGSVCVRSVHRGEL